MVARGCIFLDRDGVINVAPAPGRYVGSWDEFHLIPSITDWIRLFNVLGYLVVVVTNQRGIALGVTSQEAIDRIHAEMVDELSRRGARIDGVLVCPHHENACECRKPRTGLIREAQEKWTIDPSRSLVIGDSVRDREMAKAAGLRFVQVKDGLIVNVDAGDSADSLSPESRLGLRHA